MNLVSLIQYATYYYLRLSILKPLVIQAARSKWKDPDLVYFKDILEVATDTKTVIVGTLYKDMAKKPCILKHLDGVLGSRKARNYCSQSDSIILEDTSGRIRIRGFDDFQQGHAVTGSIIAFKGVADVNGIFHVEDFMYPGYFQKLGIPKHVQIEQDYQLQDMDRLRSAGRKLLMFISGIEIG